MENDVITALSAQPGKGGGRGGSAPERPRDIPMKSVLITGAGGEIGHGLIARLSAEGERTIIALDVNRLEPGIASRVDHEITGSILDQGLLERLFEQFQIDRIFHLAALLSTRSELVPVMAHQVNVEGTVKLLEMAQRAGEARGRPVTFLYPSSIAAYGLPDVRTKQAAGRLKEDEWTRPSTMYGCNKLYCEHLGDYYARRYKQLSVEPVSGRVDFRCVRFPGLISAQTVPSGGTSDFAPEMLHAAAQGLPYACFVRPDTRIPFMAMPDGVEALLRLAAAPHERLSRSTYNLAAFNPSAEEIRQAVVRAFPDARISYDPNALRQGIVDSWPADVDDSAARADWGFLPQYDFEKAFSEYLLPSIQRRYARKSDEGGAEVVRLPSRREATLPRGRSRVAKG
ncbi:L-threonine 3-dehydrogenase [Cystobacter fuscus DSM 2262]|uniref:L-threonine 3-dehydrogenase n=2 Tax=Cystobacter fuscus TaxID=43 RepID=S9P7N3_CYSF2|nr:L-threonine 3-dehydrogenase [Cystobacter fuscus DSM 2262]